MNKDKDTNKNNRNNIILEGYNPLGVNPQVNHNWTSTVTDLTNAKIERAEKARAALIQHTYERLT